MDKYPTLTEMGVRNPGQIEKFMVNSITDIDFLRLVYKRRKGSLLPVSHTYKFPRVQKAVPNGSNQAAAVMESCPTLKTALAELHELCKAKQQKQDLAESIREELRLLEEDIAMRTSWIAELVDRI